jgi:hypothetical protein
LVGYSLGGLEVYQTTGKTTAGKPEILDFEYKNLVSMKIEVFYRADRTTVIVEF